MDLSFFSNYTVVVIVGICLITGYIAKKWVKDLDNKYIPIILAGAFSGLASTGLHQAFKQLIEGRQ